jgi:hypothetical protein
MSFAKFLKDGASTIVAAVLPSPKVLPSRDAREEMARREEINREGARRRAERAAALGESSWLGARRRGWLK